MNFSSPKNEWYIKACKSCLGTGFSSKATCSICHGIGRVDSFGVCHAPRNYGELKSLNQAWAGDLKKVQCYSCGGDPWSANGGCGACGHSGYHMHDPLTGERFKQSTVNRAVNGDEGFKGLLQRYPPKGL